MKGNPSNKKIVAADKETASHIVIYREGGQLVYKFPELRLTRNAVERFLEEEVEPHSMGIPLFFYRCCK
jgi:hypothetical protein